MPQTIHTAAVRLCNEPAPTAERLKAAEIQVIQAAQQGAQLVVLPELFNTGYVYSRDNYTRAESIDGPTVRWMKHIAAEQGIHLAGSLLLLGPEHITNSMLLFAPDGRMWRYDKMFPWVWERLYFRAGRDITVARTDIGTFGMMICADVFLPDLFRRYAGQVDALIICTSPPRMDELLLHFPDGDHVRMMDLMPSRDKTQHNQTAGVFGENVQRAAAWMGVPIIQSVPYGQFSTHIPIPWLSFGVLLAARPSLWRHIPQGKHVIGRARFFGDNQIISASGDSLARYDAEADGFAFSEIELPASPPIPKGKPPRWPVPSPVIFHEAMTPFYRMGVRRAWGRHMAPVDFYGRAGRRLVWRVFWTGMALGWLRGRCARRRAQQRHEKTKQHKQKNQSDT
ncbi:MAG: carbon-nitrogen hydrolase family protein [Anaerolineae bacterium]|nr:carbon-nitrogen hydrolase family protein [Anaerolineae bacterium]